MRSARKRLSACLAGILACASILLYESDEGRGWAMPADSEVEVNGAAAALTKEADTMGAASIRTWKAGRSRARASLSRRRRG